MARDRGPARLARRPKFNSLVAAAQVLTAPHPVLQKVTPFKQDAWAERAWEYYDTIGELGFGVNWLGNGMSRVNLVAAAPPQGPGDEPTPLDPADLSLTKSQRRGIELVAQIAGGVGGQSQMLHGFGVHLTVAGVCWVVAEPDARRAEDGTGFLDPDADVFLDWSVRSADELRRATGDALWETGRPKIEVNDGGTWRELHPNTLIVKAWRKHPRHSHLPDAPTRRCLSVLALIDAFTLRMHADATSRLAGAGLLLLPDGAKFPKNQLRALQLQPANEEDPPEPIGDEDDFVPEPEEDDFGEMLVELMVTPVGDRASPAAIVPGIVFMPGQFIKDVKHISFATPFDEKIAELLDNSIRRLSLGMDLPPEIMTGVADVNHWTAWQVNETAITIHIEPLAEIGCHALSIGFLEPVLRSELLLAEDGQADVMVWYDTTDLRTRPDKSGNAKDGHAAGVVSDEALVLELGLSKEQMPLAPEMKRRHLVSLAMSGGATPIAIALLQVAGIITEVEGTMLIAIAQASAPTPGAPAPPPQSDGPVNGPPDTQNDEPDEAAASGALVLGCSLVVDRALERAGQRLRSAAGRKVAGGSAAIPCADPRTLHLTLDPTAYSDLDFLLEGAWSGVSEVAAATGVNETALTDQLSAYTRALLAAQQEHTRERLARALGAYAGR